MDSEIDRRKNGGGKQKEARRRTTTQAPRRTTEGSRQRGSPPQREVLEEVLDDELDRENGITQVDIRERLNNEVVHDEGVEGGPRFVEGEGENGNGETDQRLVEGGVGNDGGFAESGSSLTGRRARFRTSPKKNRGSRLGSSTNIDEIVTKTTPAIARDLPNKVYVIGRVDDESISGSAQRKKLLETSFRKDQQAPNYSIVSGGDDDIINLNNFQRSATAVRKTVSTSRNYASIDDDDDGGDAGSTGNAQVVLGGTFSASNNDQIITRSGDANPRAVAGGKNYFAALGGGDEEDDDNDGSGSTPVLQISFSLGRGGRPKIKKNGRDAQLAASRQVFRIARSSDKVQQPAVSVAGLIKGTTRNVAAAAGARFVHPKFGAVCPKSGCILSAASSSTSDGSEPGTSRITSQFPSFIRTPVFED